MIYLSMNNQLKLLLYIVFLAGVFIYVQDRFNIFDISLSFPKEQKEKILKEKSDEQKEEKDNIVEESYVEIYISEDELIKVNVEIADSDIKRSAGLSNRKYLGDYDGMLFIFEEKTNRPFWMKDMLIELDILFLDEDKFIIDIFENNEPCSEYYCPQILPSQMYKYVLEVNAGFCQNNGVKTGQSVAMHLAKSM